LLNLLGFDKISTMFSIAVFGDSITFGIGDTENKRGWVGRLREYFEPKTKYNALYNLGIPGNNSNDILARIDLECLARRSNSYPDDRFAIIIATGVNDAKTLGGKTKPQVKEDKFEKNIKLLIRKSRKYTNEIFFVGSTPVDESINPVDGNFFLNKRIGIYNEILKKVCNQEKVVFIDLFNDWVANNYKKLLSDGLHPNANGYEIIFRKIKKELISNDLLT